MTRILLTLIICVYVALAPAYADDLNTSRKVVLQFVREDGQKVALAEPANRYGGVNMQNMGDRVKIDAVKKYPITVYDPNHPNVQKATLEAAKTATATVAPSAARIAKSLARGVAPVAISMALTELLGKAVDYVLDPANNAVKYTIKGDITATNLDEFCRLKFIQTYGKDSGGRFHRFESDDPRGSISCINDQGSKIGWFQNPVASMPLSNVAEKIKDMARSGNASAQNAIQTIVKEMITNNEIDNSYFDSHITNDTYNDVVNNYITCLLYTSPSPRDRG